MVSNRSDRPTKRQTSSAPARRRRPPAQSASYSQTQQNHGAQTHKKPPSKKFAPSNQTRSHTHKEKKYATPASFTNKTMGMSALWEKNPQNKQAGAQGALRIVTLIGRLFLQLLLLIFRALRFVAQKLFMLAKRSRVALVLMLLLIALGVGCLVDTTINGNKIYAGVKVGTVDLSGKTHEEAVELLNAAYSDRIAEKQVLIFANEEAQNTLTSALDQAQNREDIALSEQISAEEAQNNKQLWATDAATLKASLPAEELAQEAFSVGRTNGGLGARFLALLKGCDIQPYLTYDTTALDQLAHDIDTSIGTVRVDFDIALDNGTASVKSGYEGNMIDRDDFAHSIDQILLGDKDAPRSFIAQLSLAPLRITETQAQKTCDAVNALIAPGAYFAYQGASWTASASDIGAWISTRVEETPEGYALIPYIDIKKAKPAILTHVQENGSGHAIAVSFSALDDTIMVHTDGNGVIPLAEETALHFDSLLFDSYRWNIFANTSEEELNSFLSEASSNPLEISVATGVAPTQLTFDEALDLGIITDFSSYTTDYSTGPGTENRNHNIRLAADLLNNSIITSQGGRWSFHETAGECNEAAGFLDAGAIVEGVYSTAYGGGICQVATTVFNAVYDAGLPVVTRHNHSLYIASYPVGRDAAVSWPDLDLVWKNDTDSDVLMRCTYTDSTITATLYGVDPEYRVSTTENAWVEGEKYKTKKEKDDSLAPGTSYVKTAGADGKSITIIRTVKDRNGTIVREDTFHSSYDPKTEVIVEGPAKNEGEKKEADAATA